MPIGEMIIAGAAVFAAALAAWTAERRLKLTLAAQAEENKAQLAHDRAMRDLDEIRRTLDKVGSQLALARMTGRELLNARREAGDDPGSSSRFKETSERLATEFATVRTRYERLVLRLGGDDPLAVCVGLVGEAGIGILEQAPLLASPDHGEAEDRIGELLTATAYFAGMFGGIARIRFASQFSEEDRLADFLDNLRAALTERGSTVELEILDSATAIVGEDKDEEEGEKQGEASGSSGP